MHIAFTFLRGHLYLFKNLSSSKKYNTLKNLKPEWEWLMGSFRNVRTCLSKLIDAIWFSHLFHLHLADYLSMQTYMLIQEYSQAHKQGAGVCLVWAHTPWKGKFVKGNWNVAGIRKNKIMPSAATRTDLKMVTLSEVSQRKTDIWYPLYAE